VPTFVRSVVIDAPVERVFAFHEREDALARLSPSFPRVRVVRRTGGIAVGSRVELRIGPLSWIARHTAYEKNRLFVDEQIQGPFRHWIHRHEFEAIGARTRLTDRVEYRLRGGPIVETLAGWVVKLGLRRMFRARHAATRTFCEAK
jgi:ligand-binding SRPBCC domain-containing protein